MKKIEKKEIWRIIDANFNRSREGLRVCEDISRFILNSPILTSELKSVRHSISAVIKRLPQPDSEMLIRSRDADGDIGRTPRSPSEMRRLNTEDIFRANMERAKESLRVLEEFFKLIDKNISAKFTSLRFRVYETEIKATVKKRAFER